MAKVEMDYKEHVKSIDKNGKYKSVEIRYIVFEAADEDTALTAVLGVAAKELNDLPLDSIEIDERCGDQTFKSMPCIKRRIFRPPGAVMTMMTMKILPSVLIAVEVQNICFTAWPRKRYSGIKTPVEQSGGMEKPGMTAKSPGWTSPQPSFGKPTLYR